MSYHVVLSSCLTFYFQSEKLLSQTAMIRKNKDGVTALEVRPSRSTLELPPLKTFTPLLREHATSQFVDGWIKENSCRACEEQQSHDPTFLKSAALALEQLCSAVCVCVCLVYIKTLLSSRLKQDGRQTGGGRMRGDDDDDGTSCRSAGCLPGGV